MMSLKLEILKYIIFRSKDRENLKKQIQLLFDLSEINAELKFNKDDERLLRKALNIKNYPPPKEWSLRDITDNLAEYLGCNDDELFSEIEKLISSLRQKDCEELIKMLPKPKEYSDLSDSTWFRAEGHNGLLTEVEQLIQDYYSK